MTGTAVRTYGTTDRGRDLRLDLFRGLALWFIFVNHIPANQFAWLTSRNYGLSDATEMFVFISGYTAAVVYAKVYAQYGWGLAAAKALHRSWTLYVTYLLLFMAFTAQVAYTAHVFDNPLFAEEMGILGFFADPSLAMAQALLLKFRPANLDILPLYIVLLLVFPLMLPLLARRPLALLAGSAVLYALTRRYGWNLPTYPEGGEWFFNPFAWQFLFVLGAAMHHLPALAAVLARPRRWLTVLAGAYLLASLALAVSWQFASLSAWMPQGLAELLYPISKTDLDPLRLLHFLALAYVVLQIARPDSAWLRWPAAAPLVACGRQSLPVFCLGIFLSFAGQTVLVQVNGSLFVQFAVTIIGIAIMTLTARTLAWYQTAARPPRAPATAIKDTGT